MAPRWELLLLTLLCTLLAAAAAASTTVPAFARDVSAARTAGCPPVVKPPPEREITKPRWLEGVLITEYFPAPERWFRGREVSAPGLPGRHRIDWLYSARGLAMQGEGIGADGRLYHFGGPYSLTWRNADGALTYPCTGVPGAWTNGSPAWIGPTWLGRGGAVTYPLSHGGWSNGQPARMIRPASSARFANGGAVTLSYWHDVAVDPRLIPHGSSIFVRAYCDTPSHGWFTAADTGGAIIGRHIDVFRAPPTVPWNSGVLRGQTVYVVPPGIVRPARIHC